VSVSDTGYSSARYTSEGGSREVCRCLLQQTWQAETC